MLMVIGTVVARPECLAEVLALSRSHAQRSRLEPGCIAHAVHQDAEEPCRLVFIEQWTDPAALQAHFTVPASRQFVKTLMALVEGTPSMNTYEANPVFL